jgi:hypothetical protein
MHGQIKKNMWIWYMEAPVIEAMGRRMDKEEGKIAAKAMPATEVLARTRMDTAQADLEALRRTPTAPAGAWT